MKERVNFGCSILMWQIMVEEMDLKDNQEKIWQKSFLKSQIFSPLYRVCLCRIHLFCDWWKKWGNKYFEGSTPYPSEVYEWGWHNALLCGSITTVERGNVLGLRKKERPE